MPHKLDNLNFSKSYRLLKPKQFKIVFKDACKIRSQYFSIFAKKNDLEIPRLGLAISKKSSKLSVSRNRIKRVIREDFRNKKELLKGFDIILVSYPKIDTLENYELKELLVKQWETLRRKFKDM